MNHQEKLIELRETLLNLPTTAFGDALFIVIDKMVDAGEDQVCDSVNNIGFSITGESIAIVDIKKGIDLAVITVNLEVN